MRKLMMACILLTTPCFGMIVSSTPSTLIRGDSASGLDRPEDVAFTPSGDYIVAANSLANTITFYKRIEGQNGVYETTASFSIKGPESQLDYPHGLSFSRDGKHLAVANRFGNSITIYKKNHSLNCYDPVPIVKIQGNLSQIAYPDAVCFSPVDNILAVANMQSHTLTLYAYQGDFFLPIPYQTISHSHLRVPDGLSFSKDGKVLGVTSHDTHCVILYKRMSKSRFQYDDYPLQILQGEETLFSFPHSLSFHPLKNYLAVSCSEGRKNVHLFSNGSKKESAAYSNAPEQSLEITEMYDESTIVLLDELMQEGGVKGVAFSPDGKSLAITQNLCEDSLLLPFPVGVLAIYPVQLE